MIAAPKSVGNWVLILIETMLVEESVSLMTKSSYFTVLSASFSKQH